MGITVDTDQAKALVTSLDKATSKALPETTTVVEKGALNIKKSWAKRWSGLAHAPAVGRAVNYDVFTGWRGPQAEIGPDKSRRQGALGNLLEYGSLKNSPIPGGAPALAEEAPRFEKALGDLAEQLALKAIGL